MTSIPLSSCQLKRFAFAFPFASWRKASPPWWGAVCLRETRDQPKPGYFLEGGRERTLGTRLINYLVTMTRKFSSYSCNGCILLKLEFLIFEANKSVGESAGNSCCSYSSPTLLLLDFVVDWPSRFHTTVWIAGEVRPWTFSYDTKRWRPGI